MGSIDSFRLSIRPLRPSPRRIWVYLPDHYKDSGITYPVLYMFDGHNLFDDDLATYGRSWRMKEYLDRRHLPLIVVGQDCSHIGSRRLEEYCPVELDPDSTFDNMVSARDLKSQGKITADWFVRVLKPACEKRYRIASGRSCVGIGGSSMGGLMALYMIAVYNDIYSRALCFSPTLNITLPQLMPVLRRAEMSADTRIVLNYGEKELGRRHSFARQMEDLLKVNALLQEKGVRSYPHILLGGSHNEATWDKAFPSSLRQIWPELYKKHTGTK